MTEIIEIIGRSTDGVTEPFICRASDSKIYYVKGKSAGKRSLINEFICGELAERFGLRIPARKILAVPQKLIKVLDRKMAKDIGDGLVFGSEFVEQNMIMTISMLGDLSSNFCSDVAAFDLWTLNSDRTLTEFGGNPNILWAFQEELPYVIDHNLAFDKDSDPNRLPLGHVFKEHFRTRLLTSNASVLWSRQIGNIMSDYNAIIDMLPNEWLYEDQALSIPTNVDFGFMQNMLSRCGDPNFWKTVR